MLTLNEMKAAVLHSRQSLAGQQAVAVAINKLNDTCQTIMAAHPNTFQVRDTSGVMHRAYPVPEAEVTPEMLNAVDNFVVGCCNATPRELTEIYRAMHALAPVPLVSEGELARFGMDPIKVVPRVELDEAVRERDEALADTDEMASRFNYWRQLATRYDREIQDANATLAARDATIAGLKSQLAAFTAANVAPEPPKPMHDFTRVWERDRRRMGP